MVRRILGLTVTLLLLAAPGASAAVPFKEIASGGPLKELALGNELSCQVAHTADAQLELFPSSAKPGSCGTFVAAAGQLYAPDFANHDGSATGSLGTYTPFAAVSQSDVAGAGTAASPFRVTTVADAGGSGLRVTDVDSYVAGQEAYRTEVTLENRGGAALTGVLYRAGDCYLQESDTGFGFTDEAASAAGCAGTANNSPAGRIEQWYPITGGARFMEAGYSEVWSFIATQRPFPNTCRCAEAVDNGAGISWTFELAPGARATFAHFTVFSPTGIAGPPPQPQSAVRPQTAFGPGGIVVAPSNRRCRSRRNFRIRLRHPRGGRRIVAATVRVNGRSVATRRGRRVTAPVDLRGLPRGRYTVSITALLDDSRIVRGTRRYRTCTPRSRRPRGATAVS